MCLFVCVWFISLTFARIYVSCEFPSNGMQYSVEISDTPIQEVQKELEIVSHLKSKYGQTFGCLFSSIEHDKLNVNLTEVDINKYIKGLLEPMSHTCLLLNHGWWTYEFCYKMHARQFHLSGLKADLPVINLGTYHSDYNWNQQDLLKENSQNGKQLYHSQMYINGTLCDINNKPRSTEVRFYCKDTAVDYIYQVQEPNSCNYIVHIYTNKICPISQFRAKIKPQQISCYPVVKENHISEHKQQTKKLGKIRLFTSLRKLINYVNIIKLNTFFLQVELKKAINSLYDSEDAAIKIIELRDTVNYLFNKLKDPSKIDNTLVKYEGTEKSEESSGIRKVKLLSSSIFLSLSNEQLDQVRNVLQVILQGQYGAILEYKKYLKMMKNYEFKWTQGNELAQKY